MRWYEYRMEVDELHASDELKAKLMAMQPSAGSISSAADDGNLRPGKKHRQAIRFPVRRVLGIAACFAVGFVACGVLYGGAANLFGFRMGSAESSAASSAAMYSRAEAPQLASYALDAADTLSTENGTAVLSEDEAEAAAGSSGGTQTALESAKIIYTANITLESKDYDAARTALDTALSEAGGYMESSSESKYSNVRNLSLTLRVPEANYASFLAAAAEAGNVTNRSEQAEDVTAQYMDVAARLENLKAQRTRLQELQAQAETLADLLEIESSLNDVQYQIESWQSQLDWYDNQISCCTVYVYLEEVQEYTPDAQNFGERLLAAFGSGWSSFVAGAQQLAVRLAGAWPVVVMIAAAAAVTVLVLRKKRRVK